MAKQTSEKFKCVKITYSGQKLYMIIHYPEQLQGRLCSMLRRNHILSPHGFATSHQLRDGGQSWIINRLGFV